MWFNIIVVLTLIICFILLLVNISESYNTEIELDIKVDENGDVILSEEEKQRKKKVIDEKKLSGVDYNKLQQLRVAQESSKKELDYGLAAYGFSPSGGINPKEYDREYDYRQQQINP